MSTIERKTSDFIMVNPTTIHVDIDPGEPPKSKFYEPRKAYWLYALKLDHNRYYVGYTGYKNPYDRIMQHVEGMGDGAKWTQMHPPIEVLEIRDAGEVTLRQVKAFEQNLTWAYMDKYGTNKVRGGIFNYPGRILRVGDRVIMGYMFSSYLMGLLVIILSILLFIEHYR